MVRYTIEIFLFACFLSCILLNSCDKVFTYNANEIRVEEKDRDQNIKNIGRLKAMPQNGSFRFVVISDSQRFYDELDDFVEKVNSYPDISFVVLNGDITDFGLNSEYAWITQRLKRLVMPYFVVIGNHDMLGNSRELYKQMFGPENFSFSYRDCKFIFLNSNSRQVGFNGSLPDMNWLQEDLSATSPDQRIFVLSHMAPFSGDFDPSLEKVYVQMLNDNGNVVYSIHGHEDIYFLGQPYGPPVNYLLVNSLRERNFVVVNVDTDSIHVEKVFF